MAFHHPQRTSAMWAPAVSTPGPGLFSRLARRWKEKDQSAAPADPEAARCIAASPPSRAMYAALRAESEAWLETEAELARDMPFALPLMEDLFHALYQADVRLNPGVDPAFRWNFHTLAVLVSCPEWEGLHGATAGDPLAAALLARRLTLQMVDEIKQAKAATKRPWHRRLGRGLDGPSIALPFGDRPKEGDPAADEQRLFRLSKMLRRHAARVREDESLRRRWSIWPGSRSLHDFDDVESLLAMARSLPWLHELMDTLDRFRALLPDAARVRRPRGPGYERVTGYTLGRNLDHLAPEEAVKLADPRLEGLFYEAYEDRRLLQHAYTGSDLRGHGPVVCCMDVSRSMNTPAALGRERFVWTKAIGLATMEWARRANRPFMGVCFSSANELASFVCEGGPAPDVALAMARCDFDGGTKFETPLSRAVQFFDARARRHGHVVFITDGEAPLSRRFTADFHAAKRRLGMTLHTVFIDGAHEPLTRLSDGVFHLKGDDVRSWEDAMRSIGRYLAGDGG